MCCVYQVRKRPSSQWTNRATDTTQIIVRLIATEGPKINPYKFLTLKNLKYFLNAGDPVSNYLVSLETLTQAVISDSATVVKCKIITKGQRVIERFDRESRSLRSVKQRSLYHDKIQSQWQIPWKYEQRAGKRGSTKRAFWYNNYDPLGMTSKVHNVIST